MERHNQVADIVYRNISAEYGLEVPASKWTTPPKIENDQAKTPWYFTIQTDKMVVAKHLYCGDQQAGEEGSSGLCCDTN